MTEGRQGSGSGPSVGNVYLVGAGPGDPGLITVKGLRLVETSDVIVHDRLVDQRVLLRARHDAEIVDVGKSPGSEHNRQADINALLVRKAGEGKTVVRLKGGDPFVFGRGGEEALELASAGVPFEVVPGVTSAVAAPAFAGIPVTHRGMASQVTIVTGSEDPEKPESSVDWQALASCGGTLVVLMGWKNLPTIVEALLSNGRSSDTPAALVQWGTGPRQKSVSADLGSIVEQGRKEGIGSPVVAVIGEVAALSDRLSWFGNRPLFGKRVLITRTRPQAGRLSAVLFERGALPVEVPAIKIEPLADYSELDGHLLRLGDYDWTILSSENNVQIVFDRLNEMGLDSRAFHGTRVVALGPATARALSDRGIAADLVPRRYVSEGVIEAMSEVGISGATVFLPRSSAGREVLVQGLTELGATVTQVPAYRPVPAEESRGLVRSALEEGVDAVTFTSSSTVRSLIDLLDGDIGALSGVKVVCIGSITAGTGAELGLKVDAVAAVSTVVGLADALENLFEGSG